MVHKETGHKISLLLSKWEWRFSSGWKRAREDFIVENRGNGLGASLCMESEKGAEADGCAEREINAMYFRFWES
jgi:hypothetical protein